MTPLTPPPTADPTEGVNDLLHEADAAFASGDADRWTACFEEYSHPMEPIT